MDLMSHIAVLVVCVLHTAVFSSAQRSGASFMLDRAMSPVDVGRLSTRIQAVPALDRLSARTISNAVSSVATGIESKLASQAAVDRSAFSAGIDSVSIAATDQVGPQHLTSQAALDIEHAGRAFLETTSGTAKRLNVPSAGIEAQFSRANIGLQDISILPRRLICPFAKSRWPRCDTSYQYRSLDGSCNNINNALWGKAFTPFERLIRPKYDDGVSEPRQRAVFGGQLPNARRISREFHLPFSNYMPKVNHFAMEYGQFVSHDIQFNALSKGYGGSNLDCCARPNRAGCFPIQIPPGDPFYTNRTCMNLVRALPTPNLQCTLGVREQLNQNTHYHDASHVYGSDKATSDSLRTFTGGLLKTSNDLLPQNSGSGAGCTITTQSRPCFRAGDPRVNQQPALISLHTIWMREHNRVARRLAQVQPTWLVDDEKLFQESRRVVVAMIQHITYNEYLPEILGNAAMIKYGLKPQSHGYFRGYDATEKPMIRNGFSTAAFRFGHSMIHDHLKTHNGFSQTTNSLLKDTFLKPDLVYTRGVDEITRGLMRSPSEAVDRYMTSQVTRHLFERQPGFGGDLAAINIQRGRDHGIPNYQRWRQHCGISGQYSHAHYIRQALQGIYSSPNDMDLFTAGVSEITVPGGKVGPTFACMIGKQFRSLKTGDRFYYENDEVGRFTQEQLKQIRRISMSKIICRNTGISQLQRNAFRDVVPGNPLVNCRYIKDIDLSKWGGVSGCQPINGAWSSWQSTPCFGHWKIRYRLCNNPAPNECGKPCSARYQIRMQFCGWSWPRRRHMRITDSISSDSVPVQIPAIAEKQSGDIASKVEATIARLVNKGKGNIDASVFEKAISSVSNSSPAIRLRDVVNVPTIRDTPRFSLRRDIMQ